VYRSYFLHIPLAVIIHELNLQKRAHEKIFCKDVHKSLSLAMKLNAIRHKEAEHQQNVCHTLDLAGLRKLSVLKNKDKRKECGRYQLRKCFEINKLSVYLYLLV
jgi:hypothetical protein